MAVNVGGTDTANANLAGSRAKVLAAGHDPGEVDAFIQHEGGARVSDQRLLSAFGVDGMPGTDTMIPGASPVGASSWGSGGGSGVSGAGGLAGIASGSAMPAAGDPAMQGFASAMGNGGDPGAQGPAFMGNAGGSLNSRLGTRTPAALQGFAAAGLRY